MRSLLLCLAFIFPMFAEDVVGFYKILDSKTGKTQTIIGVYTYGGDAYGRILATYNDDGSLADTYEKPNGIAPGIEGNATYSGLDFIYDLKKEDGKYVDGKIVDPEKGAVYDADMWKDGNTLIVVGKVLGFGQQQRWPEAQEADFPKDFKKPDLTKLVPKIPQVKRAADDADSN